MRFPTKSDIRYSKVGRWFFDFVNSYAVAKFIACLIIWAIVSIPFDLYLFARWLIDPIGFWQELALIAVAGVLIGWLQGILLFFGVVLSLMIIFEEF